MKPNGRREVIEGPDQASRGLTPDENRQFDFMASRYEGVSQAGSEVCSVQGLRTMGEPSSATIALEDHWEDSTLAAPPMGEGIGDAPPGGPGAPATSPGL